MDVSGRTAALAATLALTLVCALDLIDGRLGAPFSVGFVLIVLTVPFAVDFDPAGHVVLAEAGTNAVATFTLSRGGTLTLLAVAGTGQTATCWVVRDGKYFYVSNAGSGSVSGYRVGRSGGLTALGNTPTDKGTVDAAAAEGAE